jgi:RND family efflux transporter MFP subunit
MTRRIVVSLLLSLVFVAAGAAVFAGLLSLRPEPARGGSTRPDLAVRVREVRFGPHEEELTGYGQARALRRAEVQAEVPGVVRWVSPKLEAGATVDGPELVGGVVPTEADEGEVLVRLDDRDLRRALEDATARHARARAALKRGRALLASVRTRLVVARRDFEVSEAELKRVERLLESGNATASERDRQRLDTAIRERSVLDLEGQEQTTLADVELATADETAAVARELRARQDLARTVVRAPFRGRVESRRVEPGGRVAPGALLFTIVDPTRVEVSVALAGSRFGEVDETGDADLRLREDGPSVWSGPVTRISPVVDPLDRTFFAYFEVDGPAGAAAPVPPGAFVVARIPGRRHAGVMAVPRTAFVGDRLFVAEDEPGAGGDTAVVKVRKPSVRRWLSDVALVDGGVTEGERIVVTNLEQLAAGSRVRVVPEEAIEAPTTVGEESE